MKTQSIKIGLICVGLNGEHVELAGQFHDDAKKTFPQYGLEIVNSSDGYTLTREEVIGQAVYCRDNGASAIIFLTGTWILANHVVDAIQTVDLPVGIWGVPEPVSFSSVGANVVHGALDEMGIKHNLFYGYAGDEENMREIAAFASACYIKQKLRGKRLGVIGGRTISAYPTAADPNQIKALFGVEVEHIDQLVLLEKARAVPAGASEKIIRRVKDTYGSTDVPDDILTRAVNVYAALKQVIEEYAFDMCTMKCIGEFLDHYCSGCLALTMLNDEGFVSGCQCNVNAVLSSYIMSFLSDDPIYFGDINTVSLKDNVVRLINCGSIPGKLAGSYEDVEIKTQYEYMGMGRGACTLFCCKEGPVTFGTLGRKEGGYVMNIASGNAYEEPLSELARVRDWAQGFVKLHGDPMCFYRNIRSNHSVMAYGSFVLELRAFCELMGIGIETNI